MDPMLALIVVLALLVALYYYIPKRKEAYWRKKGLEIFEINTFQLPELSRKTYDYFKKRGLKYGVAKVFGSYRFVVNDLDTARNIMVKDFDSFRNRGPPPNEKLDPLTGHLAFLTDDKWKNLRSKLTPTFTSGKMKMMFNTMVECGEVMLKLVGESAKIKDPFEVKELMVRYATDIIGSCAFGIDCNSLGDLDSEFQKYTQKRGRTWRNYAKELLPGFVRNAIRLKETDPEEERFFTNLVKNMMDYREKNNVYRKDFLHLMLQLKNRGRIVDDGKVMDNNTPGNYMTLNEVTAQCFVFFFGGFDTSSTLLSFAFLELAQNPDVQDKLRDEIKTALKNNNGELTYESIMQMNYLDNVVNETLRLYPPAAANGRLCNKTYKVPGTDITLEPGDRVFFLLMAIQRDPDIYPDPEKFDPDRFTSQNKNKRHPFAFMPFGEGPRQCIGLRFGVLQSKVGIVSVLNKFKLTLNKRTKLPIAFNPNKVLTNVEGGVWIDATALDE